MVVRDERHRIDKHFANLLKDLKEEGNFRSIRETTEYLADPFKEFLNKKKEENKDPLKDMAERLMEI